ATYTAQYTATPNEYTATFVDDDGTTVLKEAATYAYGASIVKPDDPTKEGYTFAGWAVGGAVVDVTTMPAANTVYAATYTKNSYTITWKNANGATLDTTTVEHGAMPAYGGTAPSLSNTSKLGYTFTGWTPEIVAATEATTYTAAYKVAFLSPMTIALDSAAYDRSQGEAMVVTKVGNTDAAATTTAEATAQFKTTSVTGESTVDGTTVTSVFDNFASGRGYEWTITATQTYGAEYSEASESASIKGRTYARAAKSWFGDGDVTWNEGAFAPAAQSGSGAQVRLRATVTFPAVLPRALPEAGSAVVGITAYQPNAGVAPSYYAWNGSQWVKLVGVAPKGGVAVNLLGVVDFARKDGPAVAWYADGFQLTTEEGDWEVPLADGTQLSSFGLVGDLSVGSLSGDYDIGGQGFMLLIR
ncbi:MAG: InlB B-repeat-containing protein, partial [Kiritimatiellae bacterium]|nr:InlB B-repeat-containing protein [Kiritimatiellia bacterium]